MSDNKTSNHDDGRSADAGPAGPIISVIIPVWNGAGRIGKTLAALESQTASPRSFEVIVVDNGSTDDTAAIANGFPSVTLLSEPRPGSYRARNRAIEAATGEWLLFTDGDCVPRDNWIEHALDAARRHPDAGVIGGRIDLFRETASGEIAFQYEQIMAFNQERNIAEGRCVTANWLSPSAVIRQQGGFDAELLSGGDVAMSNRLKDAGYRFVYDDQLIVEHPTRASLSGLVSKRRRTMGGRYSLQHMRPRETPYWLKVLTRETWANVKAMAKRPLPLRIKAGLAWYFALLLLTAQLELVALSLGKRPYRS